MILVCRPAARYVRLDEVLNLPATWTPILQISPFETHPLVGRNCEIFPRRGDQTEDALTALRRQVFMRGLQSIAPSSGRPAYILTMEKSQRIS